VLVAVLAVVDTSCRKLALGGGSSAVEAFVLGLVEAVFPGCTCRRIHRTAVSAPICPAGHNIHHYIGRSCPGRVRNRSIAGRTGCRSLHAVAEPAAHVPGRSTAVVAVADSCRIVAAGTPCRRWRAV
jgi:hypothetical protein